VSVVGH